MTTIDPTRSTQPTQTPEPDPHQGPPPPVRLDESGVPFLPSVEVCLSMKAEQPSAYTGPISPDDIRQGNIGDCTLLATLGALARTEEGRARIRGMIQETGEGRWVVTLYKRFPLGYVPVKVEVSECDALKGDSKRPLTAERALWPRIIQTAMGRLCGDQIPTNLPDSAGLVLGTMPREIPTNTPDLRERMVQSFKEHKAQMLVTAGTEKDPKIQAGHAYAITDMRATREGLLVEVTNPWGRDKQWLTMDQIRADFVGYSEASPR